MLIGHPTGFQILQTLTVQGWGSSAGSAHGGSDGGSSSGVSRASVKERLRIFVDFKSLNIET